jgi:hypothetical protein
MVKLPLCLTAAAPRACVDSFPPSCIAFSAPFCVRRTPRFQRAGVHSVGTVATPERWTLIGKVLEATPLGAKAALTVNCGEDLTTTAY